MHESYPIVYLVKNNIAGTVKVTLSLIHLKIKKHVVKLLLSDCMMIWHDAMTKYLYLTRRVFYVLSMVVYFSNPSNFGQHNYLLKSQKSFFTSQIDKTSKTTKPIICFFYSRWFIMVFTRKLSIRSWYLDWKLFLWPMLPIGNAIVSKILLYTKMTDHSDITFNNFCLWNMTKFI